MTLQEMGRYLAGLRQRGRKKCAVISIAMEGTLKRVYCSQRCALKADRKRHHDAVLARQRERRQRIQGQALGEGQRKAPGWAPTTAEGQGQKAENYHR